MMRLAIRPLKGTVVHFVLVWFVWKINDDTDVPLANLWFALSHVFQLTSVCLPKTPKPCRGETLSLERPTGEWNIKQNMFS